MKINYKNTVAYIILLISATIAIDLARGYKPQKPCLKVGRCTHNIKKEKTFKKIIRIVRELEKREH